MAQILLWVRFFLTDRGRNPGSEQEKTRERLKRFVPAPIRAAIVRLLHCSRNAAALLKNRFEK
jgi:hypothetical protein